MPVISIENDPAKQRTMLPEGIYVLTCKQADAAPRKDNELELILKCDVVSCTDRSANGKQATPRLGTKFTTAIKALLEHCGVPYTEPMGAGGKPTIQFDTDHLVGKTFQAECKHNGNWERWSNFAPAGVMQQQQAAQYAPPPQTAPQLPAPQPHVPPQGTPVHPGYAPAGHPAPGYGAAPVAPQGAPGVAPQQQQSAPGYPAAPTGGYPPPGYPAAPGYPPAGAPAPGGHPGAAPAPGYPQAVPVQQQQPAPGAPQGAPAPGTPGGYPPPGYIPQG